MMRFPVQLRPVNQPRGIFRAACLTVIIVVPADIQYLFSLSGIENAGILTFV